MLTLGPTLTLAPTATQRVPGPEGAERPAPPDAATRLAPPEPKAAPSPSLLHMSAPASQRLLIVAVPLRTIGPIRVSTDARGGTRDAGRHGHMLVHRWRRKESRR